MMSSDRSGRLAVFLLPFLLMLHRAMTIDFQTLRAILPASDRFDRLLAIGWEDVGGIVLAMSAVVFMTALGALRSR